MDTYGVSCVDVPLGPIVPTTAPSATLALFATAIEPRCVSVTEYPSAVWIVSDAPFVGTVPAKLTVPPAGATTGAPAAAPMSMPRCSPAAYGCAGSKEKRWSTGPCAGQLHAPAVGAQSPSNTMTRTNRRMRSPPLLSDWKTKRAR
jgi:hypothetical protein